jgi:uncharacterized membrane protein
VGLGDVLLQTALLLVNGWLGGELAYRYRMGTIADESPEVMRFHADDTSQR